MVYRLLFCTCFDLNRMKVSMSVLMINGVCVCVSACTEGAFPSLLTPLSPDRSIPVGYHGSTPHQKTIAIRIEGIHSFSLSRFLTPWCLALSLGSGAFPSHFIPQRNKGLYCWAKSKCLHREGFCWWSLISKPVSIFYLKLHSHLLLSGEFL